MGEITFAIPQVREGGFYPSALEKGLHSERALIMTLSETYVQGVSTRKVKAITEQVCVIEISATQVSRGHQAAGRSAAGMAGTAIGSHPLPAPGCSLQTELCDKISEWGELSYRIYYVFFRKKIQPVRYKDFFIDGPVLVHPSVFYDTQTAGELIIDEDGYYQFNNLGLYGCEYTIFDPREFRSSYTSGEDNTFCLIFTRSDYLQLDGYTVSVQPDRNIQGQVNRWILETPKIILQSYLEFWIGKFSGWKKHFTSPI